MAVLMSPRGSSRNLTHVDGLLDSDGVGRAVRQALERTGSTARTGPLRVFPPLPAVEGPDRRSQSLDHALQSAKQHMDGWMEGALATTDSAVRAARAVLMEKGLPEDARVFPTAEGGILIEWRVGAKDISAEVDSESSLYVHCLDLSTGWSDDAQTNSVASAVATVNAWLS